MSKKFEPSSLRVLLDEFSLLTAELLKSFVPTRYRCSVDAPMGMDDRSDPFN